MVATGSALTRMSTNTCRPKSEASAAHPETQLSVRMSTKPIKLKSVDPQAKVFAAACQVGVIVWIVGDVPGPFFLHESVFRRVRYFFVLGLSGRFMVIELGVRRVYVS